MIQKNNKYTFRILLFCVLIKLQISAQTWQTIKGVPSSNNYCAVNFPQKDSGFVVGSSGIILASVDSGKTWNIKNGNTSNSLLSVHFYNSKIGWIAGDSGIILKTNDGGNNWIKQNSGITNKLSSVFFSDKDTGYVIGTPKTILKTVNGGDSWINISIDTIQNIRSSFFVNAQIGYILNNNYVIKSTDGGLKWNSISNSNVYSASAIFFINADTGYVVGQYYRTISKTIDGGKTWNLIVNQMSAPGLSEIYFTDNKNGYAIGGMGGEPLFNVYHYIISTNDGGQTWSKEYSISDYPISLHFTDKNLGYVVGSNGLILKFSKIDSSKVFTENDYLSSFKIFPIISNNEINIQSLSNTNIIQPTNLIIFNSTGKTCLQQTLNNEKTSIDVSTLSAGLYFVKVWNGSLCWVGRFLKE